MARQISDPELRAKLTPDYDFGCKRPTFSNDYFKAFTRDNVNLETTPIERIEPDGIVTTDGNKTDDRHPRPRHRLQPLGRQLPGDRDHRSRRPQPRQVVARQPLPGVRGRRRAALPQLPDAGQPLLLQRPVLLHDDRVADEAHEAAVRRGQQAQGLDVRGDSGGQRRVPRPDDRATSRTRCSRSGSCSTARSYYFNQHGEAAILRPTSTINAFREAGRFPLDAYSYA